jgi:hypothetical protein
MPTKRRIKKYIMSPAEYIRLKDIRTNVTGKIENGELRVLWEGQWILDKDFKAMFPLPNQLHISKDNPDGTKKYLND